MALCLFFQIFNHNLVVDGFLGQALLVAPPGEKTRETLNLVGRRSKKAENVPGRVTVEYESYDDLTFL